MSKAWTYSELKYLSENYPCMLTSELSEMLQKPIEAVRQKARELKLKKADGYREGFMKHKEAKGYREETDDMADIICFMHRRGMNYIKIGMEMKCPPAQAKEIVERCLKDGNYERFRARENKGIPDAMTVSWSKGVEFFSVFASEGV